MISVLIIDGERALATALAADLAASPAAAANVEVIAKADFPIARTLLRTKAPRLLVTALKLGEYNGLHLVYIAAAAGLATRSVVHTDALDAAQAREVRSAGAFYEIRSRLPVVLPAYLSAVLPSQDRRDPISFDRRRLVRGGRRAADVRAAL